MKIQYLQYTFTIYNYIIRGNIAFIRKRDGLHKHKMDGNLSKF